MIHLAATIIVVAALFWLVCWAIDALKAIFG